MASAIHTVVNPPSDHLDVSTCRPWALMFVLSCSCYGVRPVTATTSQTNEVVMSATTVPMDGSFVTFDDATIDLLDFLFRVPQTGVISTNGSVWGGYEELVIESATIQPGVGYSTLFGSSLGGGVFTFLAGPTDIDGVYSATDLDAILPDINNLPINVTDTSLINGTIDTNLVELEMLGITLAAIPGAGFGETQDLIVKADILFVGEIVPEPGTAALLSLGVVGLAIRSRNARKA